MDEERDIDRSWESVLRTPEQLTLDYNLVTPESSTTPSQPAN